MYYCGNVVIYVWLKAVYLNVGWFLRAARSSLPSSLYASHYFRDKCLLLAGKIASWSKALSWTGELQIKGCDIVKPVGKLNICISTYKYYLVSRFIMLLLELAKRCSVSRSEPFNQAVAGVERVPQTHLLSLTVVIYDLIASVLINWSWIVWLRPPKVMVIAESFRVRSLQ